MIDCPHNGRKNVADQMMIVDMLTFAIDNESDGSTIVLISGDRDFAYPVSILRFRMCQVIVISPTLPGAHVSLRSQASTFLDWTVMVSSLKDDKSSVDGSPPSNVNIPPPPTNTGAQNNGKSNVHDVTNLRPQTKHNPEASPPASRNEAAEREPPVAPAVIPDNTPPVYVATANTASETAPPTTPPPAGNHVHELAPVAEYVYDGLQRQAILIDESPTSPPTHLSSVLPADFSPSSCQSQSDAKGPWTISMPSTTSASPGNEADAVPITMDNTPPVYTAATIIATDEFASSTTPPSALSPKPAPPARCADDGLQRQVTGPSDEPLPPPPALTAAYSLPLSAPSPPQGQLDATATWTVPLHLQSLMRVLQKHLKNGTTQPLRSMVAAELEAQDSKVYENAGVTTFWELFRIAVKESLVWYGGQGDSVWVALRHSAAQKLQSLEDDSSLDATAPMTSTTPASLGNEALVVSATSTTDNTHTPTVRAATIAVIDPFSSPTPPAQDPESTPASRYAYDESQNRIIGALDEPLPPSPPLVPVPPSPPPSAPTPSQSHPITSELRAVPPHLRSLVLLLHKHRARGETQPLRGSIAYQLVQQDSEVYSKAGVTTFTDFMKLAVKERLVSRGGTTNRKWVSLHADALRGSSPITTDSPSPVPPSLSSSAPTPSQSESSMPGAWTVPPHLRSLVLILQKLREGGENQPSRSSVAIELVKQDRKVYQKAGVTKFKSFADLAVNARLVCLGVTMGEAWISLHHDVVNKLRSFPLI
ncbi:hypothetical protein PQX77_014351 [Marasmius sp. AFHP31]|nr:hypothetical protein PQX77_014351 [Marasmius sp. AFHP31]